MNTKRLKQGDSPGRVEPTLSASQYVQKNKHQAEGHLSSMHEHWDRWDNKKRKEKKKGSPYKAEHGTRYRISKNILRNTCGAMRAGFWSRRSWNNDMFPLVGEFLQKIRKVRHNGLSEEMATGIGLLAGTSDEFSWAVGRWFSAWRRLTLPTHAERPWHTSSSWGRWDSTPVAKGMTTLLCTSAHGIRLKTPPTPPALQTQGMDLSAGLIESSQHVPNVDASVRPYYKPPHPKVSAFHSIWQWRGKNTERLNRMCSYCAVQKIMYWVTSVLLFSGSFLWQEVSRVQNPVKITRENCQTVTLVRSCL